MAIQNTTQAEQQPATSSAVPSSNNPKKRQFRPLAELKAALEQFAEKQKHTQGEGGEAEQLVKVNGLTQSADPLVDEFFHFVASSGRPHLPWTLIQPALLWKLETVMDDMHVIEANSPQQRNADDFQKEALINDPEIRETKSFIVEKTRSFVGIPFTLQRICELLVQPNKHYQKTAVFLRALEKNVNVVTTITEEGYRITGVDEPMEDDEADAQIPVERNFIVSVDELDEPLPQKLAQQQKGEGEPATVKGEPPAEEAQTEAVAEGQNDGN